MEQYTNSSILLLYCSIVLSNVGGISSGESGSRSQSGRYKVVQPEKDRTSVRPYWTSGWHQLAGAVGSCRRDPEMWPSVRPHLRSSRYPHFQIINVPPEVDPIKPAPVVGPQVQHPIHEVKQVDQTYGPEDIHEIGKNYYLPPGGLLTGETYPQKDRKDEKSWRNGSPWGSRPCRPV